MFGRLFKIVLFLLVVGLSILVGFAYFGNLSPEQTDIQDPVSLNVD